MSESTRPAILPAHTPALPGDRLAPEFSLLDELLAKAPFEGLKRGFLTRLGGRKEFEPSSIAIELGVPPGKRSQPVPATLRSWFGERLFEQADTGRWFDLMVAALDEHEFAQRSNGYFADWAVRYCFALHGAEFAVRHWLAALLTVADDAAMLELYQQSARSGFAEVRLILCSLDAEAYASELARAHAIAKASRNACALMCQLFPQERAFAQSLLQQLPSVDSAAARYCAFLLMGAVTAEEAAQLVKRYADHSIDAWPSGTWLHLARVHGEAILPTLATALAAPVGTSRRRRMCEGIRLIGTSQALALLMARFGETEVAEVLEGWASEAPRTLLELLGQQPPAKSSLPLTRLLRGLVEDVGRVETLQWLDAQSGPAIQRLRALLDEAGLLGAVAEAAQLPPVLAAPPWAQARKRKAKTEALALEIIDERSAHWPTGLESRWRYRGDTTRTVSTDRVLSELGVSLPENRAALVSGQGFDAAASDPRIGKQCWIDAVLGLPEQIGARLLMVKPLSAFWGEPHTLRHLIVGLGADAIPVVEHLAAQRVNWGMDLALPLRSASLARLSADAAINGKLARRAGQQWLRHHFEFATRVMLADFCNGDARASRLALFALRWMLSQVEGEARMRAACQSAGGSWPEALQRLLDFDPLQEFPSRMPNLPDFWKPRKFAPVVLGNGSRLDSAAIDALGLMLMFSKPAAPYAGLDQVRASCTSRSLGQFAWDLYRAWEAAGAPSKDQWALQALAELGDDECARQLAQAIREWPSEGKIGRTPAGLAVLGRMRSELALSLMHGISQKAKSHPLRARAEKALIEVAEQRSLTRAELDDRLVPTFGLEAEGGLVLDFGPRQFRIAFDEELKPIVRDDKGKRLKDLPKPGASDNAALASAASERFKQLKKDVRGVAQQQIRRMELAMCEDRRWTRADFERWVAGHPLLAHLARRLLWTLHEDDAPVQAFRIAEDGSYAGAQDQRIELPEDGEIGLAHPLDLPAELGVAFGQIFGDYDLRQPFAQLGRDAHTLEESELPLRALTRWNGRRAETLRILGLESRGWRRGGTEDGGRINEFTRALGGGLMVTFPLSHGMPSWDPRHEPEQIVDQIVLNAQTWAEVPARLRSELVRDVESVLLPA